MTDSRDAAFYTPPRKRHRKPIDMCAARGPGGAMCYKNRGHEEAAGHSDGERRWTDGEY